MSEGLRQPGLSWQTEHTAFSQLSTSRFPGLFPAVALPPPSSNYLTVLQPGPRDGALALRGSIQLLPSDITADDKVDRQSYIPAMSDAIHRPFFPTRYKETSDKWFIFT